MEPSDRDTEPAALVRRELYRAARGLAAGPLQLTRGMLRHGRLLAEVRGDLDETEAPAGHEPVELPARPLVLFVSCAEPSGEEHAIRLVRALREVAAEWGGPPPVLAGLGGPRLAAEGVRLVGDPVGNAAMGTDVLGSVPFYRALLEEAARELRASRPDACVPVDSPALHTPLGHMARALGTPVVHYVTPQYWAWAPWRVAGYREAVDLALTILPFEPSWFRRHGVEVAHVGHPQLDVLAGVAAPPDGPERDRVVLLPGSRGKVIARNLPFLLRVLERMRRELPDLEAVVAQERPELAAEVRARLEADGSPARVRAGGLHEELARARVALSVSGTVLLDLLHHRLPAIAVYHEGGLVTRTVRPRLLTVPRFASVNLLAGEEVYPEVLHRHPGGGARDAAAVEELGGAAVRWYRDPGERARLRVALDRAAERLGPPGAARRAAEHVLARAARRARGSA